MRMGLTRQNATDGDDRLGTRGITSMIIFYRNVTIGRRRRPTQIAFGGWVSVGLSARDYPLL